MSAPQGKINQIDATTERQLLLGLIVSKEFCTKIIPILNTELFSATWASKVADWCVSYFKQHNEPIYDALPPVFERNSMYMAEEERGLIEAFLLSLDDQFTQENEGEEKGEINFNHAYWIGECITWIKGRTIEKRAKEALEKLKVGRVEEAEQALSKYRPLQVQTFEGTSLDKVDEVMTSLYEENEKAIIGRLDGDLGNFIGDICREDLIAILSGGKAGKTFLAMHMGHELAKQGANVLHVSHEMSKRQVFIRDIEMITQRSFMGYDTAPYTFFDCKLNQINRCSNPNRINNVPYKDKNGNLCEGYTECTACAKEKDSPFEIAYKTEEITKPPLSSKFSERKLKLVSRWYGKKMHVMCFPQYSATFKDVEKVLEYYRDEGITFDAICDDYINSHRNCNEWNKISEEWMYGKQLAVKWQLAMISPLHQNATGFNEEKFSIKNIQGSSQIFNHITQMLSMHQSDEESQMGIVRIKKEGVRFGRANRGDTCLVSQVREHGLICRDSLWLPWKPKVEEESTKRNKNVRR